MELVSDARPTRSVSDLAVIVLSAAKGMRTRG